MLAVLAVFAAVGQAAIIYDQTPTNTNGFSISDFRLADDFTLSSSHEITDILFFYRAQILNDLDALTYGIYSNSSGTPGILIQSGTIASGSVTRTDESALCPTCASATFSITPLPLATGIYWLEIHAGTTFTDTNSGFNVDWAAAADNASLIARFNASGLKPDTPVNSADFNQYAFQVIGTPIPEPTTLGLVAAGLLLAGLWKHRRR
jgi:hypothetical protein